MMQASDKGLAFVAQREACVLTAHRDTRLLAIGFGVNDPGLKEGDTITLEEAVARYVIKARDYEADVNKVFKDIPLSQHQFDALFSLTYNIGGTRLRAEEELIGAVRYFYATTGSPSARDWAAYYLIRAKFDDQFGTFNLSRRCREALIWINADYGDLSKLKFWPVGKMPRVDEPEIIAMPTFRSAA